MNPSTFTVMEGEDNERIDQRLARDMDVSRTAIQQWITSGDVQVNGKEIKSNYKCRTGDIIEVVPPPEASPLTAQPEAIPLDIRYEDDDVLVVNKERGMVVHPAAGHASGTLVNALLHHTDALSDVNGALRPGIVHRLDKDTSGLIVVAKTNDAHEHLAKQLQTRSLTRLYIALVHGNVSHDEGTIEAPIGRDQQQRQKMAVTNVNAKEAVTHFSVLERFSEHTLVRCRLETGRTHQIRVHMTYIGHSLVADPKYGRSRSSPLAGQALHAETLAFIHPRQQEKRTLTASLPADMQALLDNLRSG
ncbi:RluA family pseudouridine synthase [Natribacillus halophilus]|uniref:Pseudouridine synthase n=1 Tax=Natribacillus halophilus TaxID=549003 RepID=A0A1G8MGA7_9BACI|nr:RluA family pseudouridine synthase [Natribacillus halophilus]SDI66912.1 ribosomal large subunit pseudouridine synthase D [Natribacillus halophilus]